MAAQAANFLLRAGSLMILARLLDPKDFGLVGMVTALTGVLNLFRDFGLSTAAVQRASVSDEQISTLFWINVLVGVYPDRVWRWRFLRRQWLFSITSPGYSG